MNCSKYPFSAALSCRVALAALFSLCLLSLPAPARGAEGSGLAIHIVTPSITRDRTIIANGPSIELSGTVSGAAGTVSVLWQNHRGFSDLAALEQSKEAASAIEWKTRASIPLRPGLNHITIKAFEGRRAAQTSVNVLWPVSGTTQGAPVHTSFYHGRPVSYQVINGRAIYQGDIVLGNAAELDAANLRPPTATARGIGPASAPVAYPQYLWPKVSGVAQVPYTVSARDQAVTSTYDNIKSAVSEFNTQLSGVIQYVAASGSETQYVEFDFDPSVEDGVCEVTSVGYQTSPVPLVIGGAINCPVPTMLHEMGHMIGLWHEHSRMDRNNYVNFLYANVDKPNATNFDQIPDNEVDSGLYNYASIMHYIPFAFSRDGVSPTLESIPAGIPLSSTLPQYTTGDIDGIKRLYGQAPTDVTIDTNPTGLQVIVDGTTVTAPQTYNWAIGSQHTLGVASGAQTLSGQNYIFGRWNTLSTGTPQTITVAAGSGSLHAPLTSPAITNYLASFIPIHTYSPNVYPAGEGTITATPAPSNMTIDGNSVNYYEDRQNVTLTVKPNATYTFYDWYQADLLDYYSSPYTFYVLNDLSTLQAVLVQDAVTTVSATSPDIGVTGTFPGFAIVVDDATTYAVPKNFDNTYDGGGWANGQNHTLCGTSLVSGACPASNLPSQSPVTTNITYAFNEWTGSAGTQTSNSLSIQVNGNQTFTANYMPSFRAIVLPSPYCGGTVTPSASGEPYLDTFFVNGSSQPITATPVSGLSFVGWTQDMSGTANPDDVSISGQLLGTANFNSPGTAAPLTIASFSPASATASSAGLNVTINGTGFTNNSSVTYTYFNGNYRSHTYVSSTQLTIALQTGDLRTPGYFPIEVFNVGASDCGVSVQSVFAVLTTPPTPVFTITKTHTGNFSQGQKSAQYTVSVTNSGNAPTSGTVTVTETVPSGLTLVSMSGTGWTCPSGEDTCTRSDALNAGTAYPAITVTVNVSASASSPQVNEVSASGGGAAEASASNSTVITQVPASITATAGTPQSATINTSFATALQATVKDAGGKVVPGVTVTFKAPASGASATLSSGTGVTNSSGVASVTAKANATAGSYSVTASVSGVSTTASFSLTNKAGAAASIAATAGTPQSANTDTLFKTALQATVKDSEGNLVPGVTVTFAAPTSGASATFSSKTATTNSSGVATVTATANATTGAYAVTAAVSGVSTDAKFSLTNSKGVPASITATAGTPQSATIKTAFKSALQATVKDSSGNLVGGVTVTFAAPSSGASATLSSKTATTNSSGVASVTATANDTSGSYTVTATVSGVSTAAKFSLTNNP